MTFDEAFRRLIGHEGSLSMNPDDRGNWTSGIIGVGQLRGTKYGISAMTYPHLDIARLTLGEARAIAQVDFWDKISADDLPAQIRFDAFDTAFNSGPPRAIRLLQNALGVAEDGVLGPVSRAALLKADALRVVARFNGARLAFMADNPTQWRNFGRGWARRVAANLLEL